jgi:hypothetical protein
MAGGSLHAGFMDLKSSQEIFRRRKWLVTSARVECYKTYTYRVSNQVQTYLRYGYIVTYAYVMERIKYSSEFQRENFDRDTEAKAAAEASYLYPAGQVINGFYNPNNHRESVSSIRGGLQNFCSGFAFIFLSVDLLIIGIRVSIVNP